ncbi:hypothetical protein DFP72DRAFT_1072997 [Ephemerocybe angulata]|uniref:Uncharacterized protein n=1 Tax=Ephemerocybe angulata TaxID=980116 RepID=A0A8H6HQ51_9AGAR|nr:hypothetical protein DFP72DRAFT_1072997 [Tulosesus angulatus]
MAATNTSGAAFKFPPPSYDKVPQEALTESSEHGILQVTGETTEAKAIIDLQARAFVMEAAINELRATILKQEEVMKRRTEIPFPSINDPTPTLSSDATITRPSESLARREAELDSKENEIQALTEAFEQLAKAKYQLEKQRELTSRLKRGFEDVSRKTKDMEAEIRELTDANTKHGDLVISLKDALAEKDAIIAELQDGAPGRVFRGIAQKANEMEAQIEELTSAKMKQEESIASLKEDIAEKDATITELKDATPPRGSHDLTFYNAPSPYPTPSSSSYYRPPTPRPFHPSPVLGTYPRAPSGGVLDRLRTEPLNKSRDLEIEALKEQYEQRIVDLTDRLAECHTLLMNRSGGPLPLRTFGLASNYLDREERDDSYRRRISHE